MSNGDRLNTFEKTMRSKDALDAARACRQYYALLEAGWPRSKAFQLAFMGIQLLHIPGLKPLPEPDPPFALESLYASVKEAYGYVVTLEKEIASDLDFLEQVMHENR